MIILALFGPPGAGKGTQSKMLIEKYNLVYISTGDILRKEISKRTDIGKKVKAIIDRGGLVPDDIIVQIIERIFREHKNVDGFLFDGFPRTYVQAYIFDGLLQRMHKSLTSLVSLEVPKDELRRRLIDRAKTSGRTDDDIEVIENRLKEYDEKTIPVIKYYHDKGIYYPLNGIGTEAEVFGRVAEAVQQSLSKALHNVVVFGYPGAGKGTQAKKIAEKFGLVYISIGKILRGEREAGTDIGELAGNYMDRGVNVPDEIVIRVIEDKIKVNPDAKGFVFKGFPRTMVQTYIIEGILVKLRSNISCFLELEVSPLESIKRLSERGKTEKRRLYDKDTESIIKRLEEYEESTIPVINYYKEQKKLVSVCGKGSQESVFERVSKIVEDSFRKGLK